MVYELAVETDAKAGGRYELPRLAEALANPEFEALRRFLEEAKVDAGALQARIDQLVEQARKNR